MPNQMELPAQWHQRFSATLGFVVECKKHLLTSRDDSIASSTQATVMAGAQSVFGTHL